MTITTNWFIIATALTAVLASIAIWSPRSLPLKIGALICATAFLPLGYFGMNDILSRPKPMLLETVNKDIEQVQVLSSIMKENEAIYLWLQLPEVDEPRSYKLPWSEEMAKQLHKAQQDAEQDGTEVKMKKPFEKSVDSEDAVFYAAPQEAPPVKHASEDKPVLFQSATNEE